MTRAIIVSSAISAAVSVAPSPSTLNVCHKRTQSVFAVIVVAAAAASAARDYWPRLQFNAAVAGWLSTWFVVAVAASLPTGRCVLSCCCSRCCCCCCFDCQLSFKN